MSFNRRTALKGLGLGALGATLPWLRTPRAFAQTSNVPLRIVFVYGGSGSLPGSWEPVAPAGMNSPTERNFDLNEIHAPLAAYKSRMMIIENLDMVSTSQDPTGPTNAHYNGNTHALVADNRVGGEVAGNISIDQRIAQHFAGPNPATPLPSLEVAGTPDGNNPEVSPSYSAAGAPVPFLVEPPAVWNRLFPAPLDNASVRSAQDAMTFDFVRSEQSQLMQRLGTESRTKLQAHLDARSALQTRLGLSSPRAVNRPSQSLIAPWNNVDFQYNVPPSGKHAIWDATSDLNIRLAVAALHTDTTRVATINIHDCPNHTIGYDDGMFGSDNLHDLTHKVNYSGAPQSSDPSARAMVKQQHLATMDKVRLLLDLLAAAPETDGQSLLDHTLVVYTSQIADGSHSTDRLPWFVVGDGHGFFDTGRYVRLARTPSQGGVTVGRPHNDLFVSLAQAMGVNINSFGNAAVCNGPLTELHA